MKVLYFQNVSPYEIGDKIRTKINNNVIETKIIDILLIHHAKDNSSYFMYELEGIKGLVRFPQEAKP